jgi:hypothetical protein
MVYICEIMCMIFCKYSKKRLRKTNDQLIVSLNILPCHSCCLSVILFARNTCCKSVLAAELRCTVPLLILVPLPPCRVISVLLSVISFSKLELFYPINYE